MHILFTIGRVLLVLIFIVSGAQKLIDIPATATQIQSVVTIPGELQEYVGQIESVTNMQWPQILAILVGVVEVVGGLLIVFNINPVLQPLFVGLVLLFAISLGSLRLLRVRNKLDLYR